MLHFGKRSKEQLYTLHPLLQDVMNEVLKTELIDFTIIEGYRNKYRQDKFYELGRSKVKWPNGKHNMFPSSAVDIAPYIKYEISWNSKHHIFLAGVVLACSKKLGIDMRWGGNWDRDLEPITDQDFQDLAHYELILQGEKQWVL